MTPSGPDSAVAIENLAHRFGSFEALRGLTLDIRRGDIYGLLGLNGAGKTTTLRAVLGMLRADSGTIKIFGEPIPSRWLAVCDRLGATIEAPAFYPHLTGIDNLRLLHGLSRRRGARSPEQILDLVGLAGSGGVRAGRYSMGMLQRLYIGQALLSGPELLVLDEPTSNLDPRGILDVRRLIQRLNKEEGLTVLLSSHQLSEVEDLCTRVAIINRGRRIVEETVEELFRSEECWVEIAADRPDDALKFAAAQEGLCLETALAEGLLRVRLPRARRGELNTRLVQAGFVVNDFAERRPTLEDYFHQRIAQDAA